MESQPNDNEMSRTTPSLRRGASMSGEGSVRVASVRGVAPLLRMRGIEPADVLRSAGIHPQALDRPDNTIPYTAAGRLLQRAADLTGCVHLGLLIGQGNNLSTLGMLGDMVQRSPDVRTAQRSLILHMHLQTHGGAPTHSIEDESATLGYVIYQPDVEGTWQIYDLAIAYEFNVLQGLCGAQWHPTEVLFSHGKPKDLRPYRRFFRAPLQFDAGRTAIVYDKSWLDVALPNTDAAIHRALQCQIAIQELHQPDEVTEQVRRALRIMLVGGDTTEALVAKVLSLSTRTLRRLLAEEGTSFRVLFAEVHYEASRQLLVDSNMTTAQVAETLGYADASAFTRAFRRWRNTSPAAWRTKMRAGPAGA